MLWENIIPPEESEGINLYAQFMKVGHLYGDPEDDLPFCDYENPEPYTDCHERVWTESYGSCYDFQSIMHYPANA